MARASSRRRLSLLLIAYLVLTLMMSWRLVNIQVVNADEFRGLADRQVQREITLAPRRGKLYDRAGEPLAMSLAAATIYANPREVAASGMPPADVAQRLAPVLDRPVAELTEALSKDAGFVYLARQLPRRVADDVVAMKLPGVAVLEEARREYPLGSLAAQVVGFAGIDGEGLAGMELGLESILAGQAGTMSLERAPRGLEISSAPRTVSPSVPGDDVVLTIDREIQSVTERALRRTVRQYNAEAASAVVLDVRTGQVLAMASMPTFDPAELATTDADSRKNRAVTDIYEPGSVNKIITAAAALEEGVASPNELFDVPLGYKIGPKVFRDSHPPDEPQLTFRQIIEQSSNVGTIRIAERLGPKRLDRYLRKFGYGDVPGTGFPGESRGLMLPVDRWSMTSLPTISIGQGVSASLLQVANVFQTIARGGEWVQPTLVRGTVAEDGRLQPAPAPDRRRVVSTDTASKVGEMLVGVVEDEQGTCKLCAVPGYSVGGKTGTAQKPSTTYRGYEPGAYIASFVGLAPVDDPAIVVGVMIDEPRPVYYGGLVAGPAFAEIMELSLNHRRVPPSDPAARSTAEPAVAAPAAAPADPVDLAAGSTEGADELATRVEDRPASRSRDGTDPVIPEWAMEPARP
jgi:cell division protein FtsI (penicillin-binding protein 3)